MGTRQRSYQRLWRTTFCRNAAGRRLLVDPQYAESLLASDQADLIAIGREALYNPNWAVHAQVALGANTDYSLWPLQYRAFLVKRTAVADPLRNAAPQRVALRNIAYVSKASP